MQPVDGGFRFEPAVSRREMLVRERLVARLRSRFVVRVTTVVAPAGFGKTTLLAQAVADQLSSPDVLDVWLTCTADDVAASSFAEALCHAMGIEPPATAAAAVDAVAEAMWHRSPMQVTLVVDDAHEVVPGSPGADVLARLVTALPRNGHLVLSGRSPPSVPLARLDVLGDLERFGEADLLLTDDELAAFAARRGVPYEQVVGSGGWAALAELSASASPGVDADYVWEEVLGRLPVAQRRQLALVAHAGTGSEQVASAAEAWDDLTRVVVGALGAAQPPVPGDVAASWLQRLPVTMNGGPLARLLAAVGLTHDDPAAAVDQLNEAGEAFRAAGDTLGELACIAQLGHLAWWLDQPERLAGVAVRLFEMEAAGHQQAFPLACLARALIADLANDGQATLAELDRIPVTALNDRWMSLVDWMRAVTLAHLGRPIEAGRAAERARHHAGPLYGPLVETARLTAVWMTGGVDETLASMPDLVERSEAAGMRDYTAVLAATHATLLAVAGRPHDALAYVARARALAASPDLALVDVNVIQAEATARIALGDEESAAEMLREYLGRAPALGTGLGAFAQQRALALWYVLVPDSRPTWEALPLGPYFTTARQLARAVVAGRAGPRSRPPELGPVEHGILRAFLPLPWATELALAQLGAGHQTGWDLLDTLWPEAQPHVRGHSRNRASPVYRAARTALARLPVPPVGRLDLSLLGPVELRRDGIPVDASEWRRRRVRALLAHLVLDRPASRDRLGMDLWPDLDADAQSRNLRVTFTHLMRVLEPDREEREASFLVRSHGGHLLLHRGEWFDTDVWRFDELSQRGLDANRRGEPSAALAAMVEAASLWRGDPSELAAEEWALSEVEDRRVRLVAVATRAGELLLVREGPDEARAMGELALTVDPWSDRAHHLVVTAYIAVGSRRAAQRALDRYRDALLEVGLSPDEADRRLDALSLQMSPGSR